MNTTDLTPIPPRPNLEQYKKQAKDRVKASRDAGQAAPLTLAAAHRQIAIEHGFLSWPKFSAHLRELVRANSPVSQFEAAAEAIVHGDATTLSGLLRDNPDLIRARSPRAHRATLLHYIGANGFENYRQKTPSNAPAILRILLDAGAEVDAPGDMYGTGTALGLVATSAHPKRAGVQLELMQMLLDAGASPDGVEGGWNPLDSALANGRPEAARFLADHGARISLQGAGGTGRLALLKSLCTPDVTARDLDRALAFACQYGELNCAEFLLERGVSIDGTPACHHLPPLHCAILGEHLEIVRLLVARGASLETKNEFGGIALDCTLWWACNGGDTGRCVEILKILLAAGSRVEPEWRTGIAVIDALLES